MPRQLPVAPIEHQGHRLPPRGCSDASWTGSKASPGPRGPNERDPPPSPTRNVVQPAVREAARKADLRKPVAPHIFRPSFATHLLEDGHDIRTIQKMPGRKDVATTLIYTNLANRLGPAEVRSPLDPK
jgi:integrase